MTHIFLTSIFLQAEGIGGSLGLFMPMILIFVIMYFLIFRPQAKKQKEQKKMISEITKGDKVITAGGIYGTVVGVKEKDATLVVEIDKNVKVELTRSSIAKKLD